MTADTIVVGAGLAGLSCAVELAERGRSVLVLESADRVGGRCSSWSEDGMAVESAYHRMLGAYTALPDLLSRVGVDVDDIVCWEDEVEIRSADGSSAVLGASPLHRPVHTMLGPVSAASPLSVPDTILGGARAVLDAAPVPRMMTSPLRTAVLDPIEDIADRVYEAVEDWPAPLRQLAVPLVERGLLSRADLASLGPFFAAGVAAFAVSPTSLDRWSVRRMARRFGVSERAQLNILAAATAGLFFLPPQRFSAANLFGIVHASVPELHRQRLGAFLGGMTEIMCQPIADGAAARGATIRTGVSVSELIGDGDEIRGVRTAAGEELFADQVVLATALGAAQDLLRPLLSRDRWYRPLLRATTTPTINIQFELDRPSMHLDRTTFGPGTCVGNFAEQSRTTFTHVPGRCQITLTPPERFLDMPSGWIAKRALRGAGRLGLDFADSVTRYRVISQPRDFLGLEPGNFGRRPSNRTPTPGLVLAGDYTDQKWLSLMEGAVLSGREAARVVLENHA